VILDTYLLVILKVVSDNVSVKNLSKYDLDKHIKLH